MKSISRPKLKDYFKNGSRPTEDHFGAFIEATINKEDDEIFISEERNIGIGTMPEDGIRVKVDGSIQANELKIGDRKMDRILWLPVSDSPQDIHYGDGRVTIGTKAASEQLTVDGAIRIGNNFGEEPGTIRWTGSDFEGRKGDHWVSLTREFEDKEHFESLRIDKTLTVGTSQPSAQVHFEGGAFLVNGNVGGTPVSGYGTRLMWVPAKAALRAGFTQDNSWDEQNIGFNSVAFGNNTRATGEGSFAIGANTEASGNLAIALGSGSKATNHEAVAIGSGTEASGNIATAFGSQTRASGPYAVAMGSQTSSESWASTALGLETRSAGWGSLSSGRGTVAGSFGALAIGRYNLDTGHESSWIEDDPVFTVGDGNSNEDRSNSLLLQKKGDLSIKGSLKLGSTETHVQEGSIRWTGADFEGFIGTEWISFTKGHDQAGSHWQYQQSSHALTYEGGFVGVGTNRPASLMTIANKMGSGPQQGIESIGNYNLLLRSGETTPGTMVGIALHPGTDSSSGTHAFASITAKRINNYNAEIGFVTKDGSNPPTQKVVIRSTGELGIGIPNPREKLDVDGAIKVSKSIGNDPGTIRWTGTDFEGRKGNEWVSLTETNTQAGYWSKIPNEEIIEYPGTVKIGSNAPQSRPALDVRGRIEMTHPTGNEINFGTVYPSWISGRQGSGSGYIMMRAGNQQSSLVSIRANGKMGIGVEYPSEKLTVSGIIQSSSGGFRFPDGTLQTSAAVSNGYGTWNMDSGGSEHLTISAGSQTYGGALHLGIATPYQYSSRSWNIQSFQNMLWIQASAQSPAITIIEQGDVGIGTMLPKHKLHVVGNIHAESGSVTQSDFAEYFESSDKKTIPAGTAVILVNGKIRKVKKNETPFGVISASPGLVGGAYSEWPDKYERDEYGAIIKEKVREEILVPKTKKIKGERQKMVTRKVTETVNQQEVVKKGNKYVQVEKKKKITKEVQEPVFKEVDLYDSSGKEKIGKHRIPTMETYVEEELILDKDGQQVMIGSGKFRTVEKPRINPDYDPDKTYIPRHDRPEWNCVGLMGQVSLRKGQPVAPTWVKLKDVSENVELWLIK